MRDCIHILTWNTQKRDFKSWCDHHFGGASGEFTPEIQANEYFQMKPMIAVWGKSILVEEGAFSLVF